MCRKHVDIRIVKGLAIFMNVFVIAIAAAACARAFTLYKQFDIYDPILQSQKLYKPYLAGAILLAISIAIVFYGFIALCVNGFGMLICYCLLLSLHGIVIFVTGFYTHVTSIQNQANLYYRYIVDESSNVTADIFAMKALDNVQNDLSCCGLRMGKNMYYNKSLSIPPSCCKTQIEDCSGEDVWPQNCIKKIEKHCLLHSRWIYIIEWMFSGFMFTNSGVAYLHAMAVKHFFYY